MASKTDNASMGKVLKKQEALLRDMVFLIWSDRTGCTHKGLKMFDTCIPACRLRWWRPTQTRHGQGAEEAGDAVTFGGTVCILADQ